MINLKTLLFNAINHICIIFGVLPKTNSADFKKVLSGSFLGKKYHIVNGATLTVENKNTDIKKIEEDITDTAKKYLKQPEKLFEFIKSKGTSVYIIKNADKLLSLIGEYEGFILPKHGFKALYLNIILNKKFSLKTDEVFVLRSYNTIESVLLYQFYNWYCFKYKVEGFETSSQEKLKKVFKICSSFDELDSLTFDDLMTLKTVVRRDIEAIEFVQNYMLKNKVARKKLEKIKTGKLVKV